MTAPKQSGGGIVSARVGAQAQPDPAQQQATGAALTSPGLQLGATTDPSGGMRLEQARRLIARGRVIEARVLLQSIMGVTPAAALHELGRSYDPFYLGQLPSIDEGSEPRRAAELYQQAIIHGASGAGPDLDRLRAGNPSLR